MNNVRTAIRALGVLGLLGILVAVLFGDNRPLSNGSAAPHVRARMPDGQVAELTLTGGDKPWVVNIWATWCPPCLAEMPELVASHERYKDRVRFLGLAADSEHAKVVQMVERFRIPYDIAEIDGRTAHEWNATSLPSTYIVAADGTILWSVRGAIDADLLSAKLEAYALR